MFSGSIETENVFTRERKIQKREKRKKRRKTKWKKKIRKTERKKEKKKEKQDGIRETKKKEFTIMCNNLKLKHLTFIGYLMSKPSLLKNSSGSIQSQPSGWGCRIHWLHLIREITPPHNKCPSYDIKHSDGEAPVLEIWEIQSTFSLPLLQVHSEAPKW